MNVVMLGAVAAFVALTLASGAPTVLGAGRELTPPSPGQPPGPQPLLGRPAVTPLVPTQPASGQPSVTQPVPVQPSVPQPSTPGQPAMTQPSPSQPPQGPLPPARPTVTGQRERIEGVVQSVEGSTMRVMSDTGETMVVDLSRVTKKVHQMVAKGERVTVIGVKAPGSDRLTAQAVIGDVVEGGPPAALPRLEKPSPTGGR